MSAVAFRKILDQTRDADPRARASAARRLCPCTLKVDRLDAWDRIVDLCTGEDVRVRSRVLHVRCDGSPREREAQTAMALDEMASDPDPRLRRRVRRLLARYPRTGRRNGS